MICIGMGTNYVIYVSLRAVVAFDVLDHCRAGIISTTINDNDLVLSIASISHDNGVAGF